MSIAIYRCPNCKYLGVPRCRLCGGGIIEIDNISDLNNFAIHYTDYHGLDSVGQSVQSLFHAGYCELAKAIILAELYYRAWQLDFYKDSP